MAEQIISFANSAMSPSRMRLRFTSAGSPLILLLAVGVANLGKRIACNVLLRPGSGWDTVMRYSALALAAACMYPGIFLTFFFFFLGGGAGGARQLWAIPRVGGGM